MLARSAVEPCGKSQKRAGFCDFIVKGSLRSGSIVFFSSIFLLATGARMRGQQASPALQEAIEGTQASIATFNSALPSIYCDESLHSFEIRGGKTKREQRVTSLIEVRRQDGNSKEPFKEERKLRTVNGKTLLAGTTLQLKLPLMISGGFGEDFSSFFAPDIVSCNSYQILHQDPAHDGDGIALLVSAGESAARNTDCDRLPPHRTATFWLTRGNWELLRAEIHYPQSRIGEITGLTVITNFAANSFGQKSYVIPAKVSAVLGGASGNDRLMYSAEYSNCHKFDVTSRIVPDTGDLPQ